MSEAKKEKPKPTKVENPRGKGWLVLTYRTLDRYAGGFQLLLARLMPDVPKRQRAVFLYNECVKPAHTAFMEVLRPLQTEESEAALIADESERLREMLRLKAESDALWDSEVEIPAPRRKLAEDDLPREVKGTIKGPIVNGSATVVNGKDNASDNGRITDALYPDFLTLENPDKEAGEKTPSEPGDEGGGE